MRSVLFGNYSSEQNVQVSVYIQYINCIHLQICNEDKQLINILLSQLRVNSCILFYALYSFYDQKLKTIQALKKHEKSEMYQCLD